MSGYDPAPGVVVLGTMGPWFSAGGRISVLCAFYKELGLLGPACKYMQLELSRVLGFLIATIGIHLEDSFRGTIPFVGQARSHHNAAWSSTGCQMQYITKYSQVT